MKNLKLILAICLLVARLKQHCTPYMCILRNLSMNCRCTIMTIKLFVFFLACCVLSCTKTHEQDFNSEQNEIQSIDNIAPLSPFPYCNTDPNPIGGGAGYNQIYTSQDADIYIEDYLGAVNFKNTIENAPIGSRIFIKGTLTID